MKLIDRAGTFIGTIAEAALGETAKGFPQLVARFVATKYYVNTAELMAHYQLAEPAYVDYTDEYVIAYLVLFNDSGPLKNYEQIQAATGWDGTDFATLSDIVGKTVLFRVEEDNYNNKVQLKVNWIDAADAPPERTLRSVDADKAKALTSKFLGGMKKPAAPAKPVLPSPKSAAVAPTPATVPNTTASSPKSLSTTPTVTTPAAAETPKRKKTAAAAPPQAAPPVSAPPAPAPSPAATAVPSECSKLEAWEYVNTPEIKGTNDDTVLQEAWIAATSEIGGEVDEAAFTPAMWAQVRDVIIADLGGK